MTPLIYPHPWLPTTVAPAGTGERILETKGLTAPNGIQFRAQVIDYQDPEEEPELSLPQALDAARRKSDGVTFNGKDRKAAKLSISSAKIEPLFASVADLINTLPKDADIEADPNMSEGIDPQRVAREERNVTVRAYLYVAKQTDNDYHLILGGDEGTTRGRFINAEISGLPKTGPFRERLKTVREHFEDYFGGSPPGHNYYVPERRIPVEVTGSLFFDVWHYHKHSKIGPASSRPKTYWEIHPITEIRFDSPN